MILLFSLASNCIFLPRKQGFYVTIIDVLKICYQNMLVVAATVVKVF